jgi:superfamily I DNA/RNA helicase/RecB family exonuclease
MDRKRPVAETLFDLLDAADHSIAPETRIGPEEWDSSLSPGEAARMVVGGPGTGKTSFLCETVKRAVVDGAEPGRILVLGFSRRGVDDLRTRLVERIGPAAHRIRVTTSHSLAMRLVERHTETLGWARPPSLLTGVEQEALVASLLADEEPGAWPIPFRDLLTSETLASELTDFLLRSHEQMLTADDIEAVARADWRAIPSFIRRYERIARADGRIDYGLVIAEALRLAHLDPDRLREFDLVVADEYQDTVPAQAALLMACTGADTGLVVAADPYQSIFSFRGADIANVYSFPSDVQAALGRATERIVLDTSFRVPEAILSAAVAVTARELPGGAGKVHSLRPGGTVSCHEFATIGEEAEWIASDVERMHLLDGIALERIAVFVRSDGPFVADLARAFARHGIRHTHSDQRLVDEPVVRFVADLVRAAVRDDDAAPAMRRVLLGPFVRAPQGLVSTLDDDPDTWPAWITDNLAAQAPIAGLLEDATWATESDAPTGLWHVWSTVPGLAEVAVDPSGDRHRRAWSAYSQVLERGLARGQRRTLLEQVELAGSVDFEADNLFDLTNGGVTVATLHQAKGTEFDIVFIADAVEGKLPDLRHRDSLLGVRHLHPHLPAATADYVTFRLDEERRLAYTAMTRASSRVVWTATVPSDHGSGSAPSRFMRLVAPTTPVAVDTEPLTPRALIAAVRRTVADPTASPVARLAGISFLAGGAGGHHDPFEAYGTRLRGPDRGTVPPGLRLSPSQAHEYDRCPRRYAIGRFLLSLDDESPYLLIGNAVHTALERAEAAALAAGNDRSSLRDALDALDAIWADAGFADDQVGAAWHRRARRILETLYDGWPTSARTVAVEAPLEATIGDADWSGRADRVERAGTTLRIIDYKTSASPVTRDEAAVSLQLGFYAHAAAADPAIAALGTVGGASFWFPAAKPNRSGIATRDLDMDRLPEVVGRLGDIAAAIRAEAFDPTPNRDCDRCTVRSVCPAFPVGREAFA